MGKTNAQRQAAWRQRARDARAYQKQQTSRPIERQLSVRELLAWAKEEVRAEMQQEQEQEQQAPVSEADGGLLARLQAAYSAAAREAARHVVAYGLEALAESGVAEEDYDPEQEARDRAGLQAWMQVFEQPVGEDVLLSVAEAAGRRAGETLPAQTVLDILHRRSEAEKRSRERTEPPPPRARSRRPARADGRNDVHQRITAS